ncbi:MAG: ATP-binding protein, partial [Thermoplasmata archaeon]
MQVEAIKRVLVSQREEIDELFRTERIVPRRTPDLLRFLARPNILAVLGVRRCGKSVLSNLLLRGMEYGFVNFDDERLSGIKARELDSVLEAMYSLHGPGLQYIVIDEAQNVPGWELFASRLRRTKRLLVTGSSAGLLSGELAARLTGRYIDFTLLPFSFDEFMLVRNFRVSDEVIYSTKGIASLKSLLQSYISTGGFPEAAQLGQGILRRIYDDIVTKDAILRYGVRYRATFRDMARYLMANSGHEITFSGLGRLFGLRDVHTVKNYVEFLSSVYLIFTLERFSRRLKQRALAPRKLYAIDTGLAGAVAPPESEARGRMMENAVAVELLRRAQLSDRPRELFYWKDHQQREVDFVVVEGGRATELIQVCHHFEDERTERRELDALARASRELGCRRLTLL